MLKLRKLNQVLFSSILSSHPSYKQKFQDQQQFESEEFENQRPQLQKENEELKSVIKINKEKYNKQFEEISTKHKQMLMTLQTEKEDLKNQIHTNM
jgi:hypothetical protein